MNIKPCQYVIETKVTKEMTAKAIKEGAAEVLSTPYMIELMESASCDAIAPYLEEGYISVGTIVNIKHIRATAVGDVVKTTATVKEIKGAKVLFDVVCETAKGVVGIGEHGRYIVHHETFLQNIKN